MYIDSVHKNSNNYTFSSFGNLLICSDSESNDKTIEFPIGYDLDSNLIFRVLFTNGHVCDSTSSHLTLNNINVVVNKHGVLVPLPTHKITENNIISYKALQRNTILEMYYTSNYDGYNTPAFVIVGNPIVLSSDNYTIYADGFIKQWGRCTAFSFTLPIAYSDTNYSITYSNVDDTSSMGIYSKTNAAFSFSRQGTYDYITQGY